MPIVVYASGFWCRDSAVLICVQPGDHRQAIREALIARRSLDAGMCVIALRFCAFLDCDSDVENLPSLVPSLLKLAK